MYPGSEYIYRIINPQQKDEEDFKYLTQEKQTEINQQILDGPDNPGKRFLQRVLGDKQDENGKELISQSVKTVPDEFGKDYDEEIPF